MKTLDEVIKAWSICFSDNSRSDCTGCPYADEDGEAACFNHDRVDALYYLKHLQEYYEMSREHHEPNPALTWDQLKQMEGKPVWVENLDELDGDVLCGYWIIVDAFTGRNEKLACMHTNQPFLCLWKSKQGKTWQAYRKERE